MEILDSGDKPNLASPVGWGRTEWHGAYHYCSHEHIGRRSTCYPRGRSGTFSLFRSRAYIHKRGPARPTNFCSFYEQGPAAAEVTCSGSLSVINKYERRLVPHTRLLLATSRGRPVTIVSGVSDCLPFPASLESEYAGPGLKTPEKAGVRFPQTLLNASALVTNPSTCLPCLR